MVFATRTVAVGDTAPLFNLPDQTGKATVLRDKAGSRLLLFFYAKDALPACEEVACLMRDLKPLWQQYDIHPYGISLDAPEARAEFALHHNIPYPLLSDLDQECSLRYGVCGVSSPDQSKSTLTYARCAFLLDENLRVLNIYRLLDLQDFQSEIAADLAAYFPPVETKIIRHYTHAPIVIIPNVLPQAMCQELIRIWETEGNEDSGFMRPDGDKTIGVYDYSFKIRRDHFIQEGDMKVRLDRLMKRRVFPEVQKAFQVELSRREDYKIACYDGSRGGYFRKHRDNTSGGTAHRQFAMTLNLNVGEYEGGYLRFPEYGPHLYQAETGSAIIFSCSLMHEATDVTQGKRFALLSFFYDDENAERRVMYEQKYGGEYETIRVESY